MAVASKTYVVGEVLTAGTMNTFVRDNLAELQSNKTVIKVGTYSGDGSTGQAITGVGFTPIFVQVWNRAADGGTAQVFFTTTDYIATDPQGIAIRIQGADVEGQDDSIIALGSDGFTVDDDAADDHTKKIGIDYHYVACGQE